MTSLVVGCYNLIHTACYSLAGLVLGGERADQLVGLVRPCQAVACTWDRVVI